VCRHHPVQCRPLENRDITYARSAGVGKQLPLSYLSGEDHPSVGWGGRALRVPCGDPQPKFVLWQHEVHDYSYLLDLGVGTLAISADLPLLSF